MKKEFVSYEQAVALKELGFSMPYPIGGYQGESVFYFQNGKLYYDYSPMYSSSAHDAQILAPLKQQVFRWFRESYRLYSTIIFRVSMEDNNEYWDWLIKGEEVVYRHFNTYEEAENACIDKLIELAKQQDK